MKSLSIILVSFVFLHCGHASQPPTTIDEAAAGPTKAEPKTATKTWRFAIISDLNSSYGSKTYNSAVKSAVSYLADANNKIDFILSTGDMVAGQKKNLDYLGMWEAFHSTVTRKLLEKEIPLFPSPGNHDAHLTRKIERDHYRNSWLQENPLSVAKHIRWVEGVEQDFPFQYALTIGNALFVALDNTAVRNWSDNTLVWLEKVFTQESQRSLKFVYGHVPLLPFAFKKETEYVARGSAAFLNKVEDLFEAHKVDVFFSGHSHVYYPGRRDQHTQYISVPLLGSGSRYLIGTGSVNERSPQAFLVIEYDEQGHWQLQHRQARGFNLILDESFPTTIQIPAQNSSLCKSCSKFPQSHMLDPQQRILYRRQDL